MQGIEKPEVVNLNRSLTVGAIPGRKGVYLGLVEDNQYIPLARFTSEEKAKRFLRTMRSLQANVETDA
jgi:hypothetical protein